MCHLIDLFILFNVDGKRSMRFQSENTVFKFLHLRVDGAFNNCVNIHTPCDYFLYLAGAGRPFFLPSAKLNLSFM